MEGCSHAWTIGDAIQKLSEARVCGYGGAVIFVVGIHICSPEYNVDVVAF
jgi:hypothetical protein